MRRVLTFIVYPWIDGGWREREGARCGGRRTHGEAFCWGFCSVAVMDDVFDISLDHSAEWVAIQRCLQGRGGGHLSL